MNNKIHYAMVEVTKPDTRGRLRRSWDWLNCKYVSPEILKIGGLTLPHRPNQGDKLTIRTTSIGQNVHLLKEPLDVIVNRDSFTPKSSCGGKPFVDSFILHTTLLSIPGEIRTDFYLEHDPDYSRDVVGNIISD